ncbi:MAG: N-acetylneuraminate synthase [Promethearchaeota archaeon]
MKEINIAGKKIGLNSPIFLIAEVGVNHNGEVSIAKELVELAARANFDAIKFQTFSADNLLLKSTPKVQYQKFNSDDQENFYDMIKKYELSKKDFKELQIYSSKYNIIFLSTPFDMISVDLLDQLDVPAYKVGSGDMNNFPLLEKICSKGKPILLSTGMATLEEVKNSVGFIKSRNVEEIVIFQCTTNYPASLKEINLNVIDTFMHEFPDHLIGFSDHSIGFEASIGAAAKGVKVIEKHITLDKGMEGPDHKASLGPEDLENWTRSIRNLEESLGSFRKVPSKIELEIAKTVRKSIVTTKDLIKGDIFSKENLGVKRPGYGISPVDYEKLLGKKAKKEISRDSLIYWEDVE